MRDWVIAHGAAGGTGFELIDYFPSPETLVGAGFASFTPTLVGALQDRGMALATAMAICIAGSGTLLSILIWLHFGVIAFSGFIRGFNARRASIAATTGLVVLILSLLLVLVPGATFHSQL